MRLQGGARPVDEEEEANSQEEQEANMGHQRWSTVYAQGQQSTEGKYAANQSQVQQQHCRLLHSHTRHLVKHTFMSHTHMMQRDYVLI